MTLFNEEEDVRREIGDYYLDLYDYRLYDKFDNYFTNYKHVDLIYINNVRYDGDGYISGHELEILEVINNKIIVHFYDFNRSEFLGIYEIDDLSRPKLLLNIEDIILRRLEDKILISVKTENELNYLTYYIPNSN